MKIHYAKAHMEAAFAYAKLSYCTRRQVGCVIVKQDGTTSIGFNGTPPNWDNRCEDESGKTYPYVLHAEANAISKMAKHGGGGTGASVFVTASPCLDCAKQLASIGIKELYYAIERQDRSGIEFLEQSNIPVIKMTI